MSSQTTANDDCCETEPFDEQKQADAAAISEMGISESQYKENLVIREVSEILTSLPETASKYAMGTGGKTAIRDNLKQKHTARDSSDNDNSSHDDSLSESSNEDDESEVESSDLDEVTSLSLRRLCMDEISSIERQFQHLRDRLHKERHIQVTKRSVEVSTETAPEYLQQLCILQQQKEIKLQVAEVLREFRKQSLEERVKAEKLGNTQHLNNQKKILKGKIQADLDEKIRRLEEDRNNVDTDYWPDPTRPGGYEGEKSLKGKKNKKKEETPLFTFGNLKRKKKPVTVTGPYIVYMLKDSDISDDWTAIRRAVNVSHRRSTFKNLKKLPYCRYEDGKFHWGGKLFLKGQAIVIRRMINEAKYVGTIMELSATQILIRQNNGKKSKLHVNLLQRGKYTIQHR